MLNRAVWQGVVAGLTGTVVMTVGEKVEQRMTGRPDSHVPARVLERLLGTAEQPGRQPLPVNWAMHFGQGALIGVLRSVMANVGLRGPVASAMFTVVRLTNDQILENATGVGAPPPTWPRPELAVDLLHKAVYGLATGAVADALAARTGRESGVGPLPRRGSGAVTGSPGRDGMSGRRARPGWGARLARRGGSTGCGGGRRDVR